MKAVQWLFLVLFASQPSFSQHVVFGERKADFHYPAIYLDKEGFCYPTLFISDSAMFRCESSLRNWYKANPTVSDSLLSRFHISRSSRALDQLNDSILAEALTQFNTNNDSTTSVTIFVHGFRKSYYPNGIDVTSGEEYQLAIAEMARYGTSKRRPLFVFWDGMYDCCFSLNTKKNKALFHLFETAVEQSFLVGKTLSTVIQNLDSKDIALIGHSLGSQVVSTAVLSSSSPSKHLRVALIAPAMSAAYIKKMYLQNRNIQPINWMILYNEDDFVLHKKDNKIGLIGPGPKKYGTTTFGCNWRKETEKWQQWMRLNIPNATVTLVDKTALSKCHSLRCYTRNDELKEIWLFLEN